MNFEDWQEMENAALNVIDTFAAAGVRVPTSHGTALTSIDRVVYLKGRARAMDAAVGDILPVPVNSPRRPTKRVVRRAYDMVRPVPLHQKQPAKRVGHRCGASDSRPQSDLDFYTQCAAESTRLA